MPGTKELLDTTAPAAARAQPHLPGSFGALVDDYFASPEFTGTKPATQSMYRRVLEPIAERIGHHAVSHIERRHVKAMRDEKADTPGMANMVVKVAYALALYTGQRCGDLAAMTRAHRKDGVIRVVQEKTGAELWLREHRELAAELKRGDQANMSLLVSPSGTGFGKDNLGHWFADAIDKAGLPDDCVLHGLRKTAAKALADAGCTAHEIMAVTGHKSLTEVQRYTVEASRRVGASAAILKLEANAPGTGVANGLASRGLSHWDNWSSP